MQQTNTSFSELLNKAPSEVERPKPLPTGTYNTMIEGLPRYDKSSKKQTQFVEFTHKMLSAGDDVDPDNLKEVLNGKPLQEIRMKNTFYLTENSLWRLKDFLGHLGYDVDASDVTLQEMVEDTAGKQVAVFIKHEPSQDGTSIFARIDRTLPVE